MSHILPLRTQLQRSARSTVGASLLAIAVGQLAPMLNVPPSSRAGSLPQGASVFTRKYQA
ncbi:hypothetical protein FHJ31_09005 [Pseudomonas sp. Fig-3]|nr:hypothetical protein FHJ31_09005 [Pseudomonas sp. Fig-3]